MKILLVTVAGMSTRFSESVGEACLKCIYYRKSIEESLLYQLLHRSEEFDRLIVVGGYLYEKLEAFVEEHFTDLRDKITLVKNEKYAEYGSGYSLYTGMKEATAFPFDELVFAEGDLFLDKPSFQRLVDSKKDVITYNRDPILANKAVALYFDQSDQVHYIYDVSHNALEIGEPFQGIYNSGQVWKFVQPDRVCRIMEQMKEEEWQGTNLIFIQNYFGGMPKEAYELIGFEEWVNCNTITDFEKVGQ